jgi:hypothetical protein
MAELVVIFLAFLLLALTLVSCWFISEYNMVLAKKFPEGVKELSIRFFVSNFGALKRLRKALKLNDPELTKIAKKVLFVMFSMLLCMIGIIVFAMAI